MLIEEVAQSRCRLGVISGIGFADETFKHLVKQIAHVARPESFAERVERLQTENTARIDSIRIA